ncbi:MAG: hypothetical protein K2Q20_03415 [Phycisphaerales bacterium]|nr:hypothetical protein [Phycisphaerales bacterium]
MRVFVFHGAGSRFANAVFSSKVSAEAWITLHGLTGLLTEYEVDSPAFDRRMKDGTLPRNMRESLVSGEATGAFAQCYADGARHSHYFHGLGEEAPGFADASERWEREHGGQ